MRTPILSEEESLEQHREAARRWKKANPEKNREAVKQWKKRHPEEYKSYQSMMMVCPCGAVVTRNHLSRHRQSRVHKDWIEQNKVPDLEIYKNCFVVCE
jgi:acyl-CoA thioesterase